MRYNFLALGDSYTVGEGVPESDRWPVQLVARLRGEGIGIGDPQIVAQTGWTTDELLAAMDVATFEPPYALVTLLVGVNNQYRGRPLDEYRAQFQALLKRAVALAGGNAGNVVVVSIPDWGVTPFAHRDGRDGRRIAREIDAFNATAGADVRATGAGWADVTTISREPDTSEELVADGLHPSGAQYVRWVDAILPAARMVLKAS